MVKHTAVTLVLTCCTVAMAVGDNTHPQGVRFAGPGLDEQTAMQPAKSVPWFKNDKSWPPPSGTYESIGGPKKLFIKVNCLRSREDSNPDPFFALCTGEVRETAKDGPFVRACGLSPVTQDNTVRLLAIRGKVNEVKGEFKYDKKLVTFACAPTFNPNVTSLFHFDPNLHQPPIDHPSDLDDTRTHHLGVLAKCYFWGFGETKNDAPSYDKKLRTYQACIRAARADYCGDGISYTESGTLIQIYEPEATKVGDPIKVRQDPPRCQMAIPRFRFRPCFEAIWDENGALCVSHARWENMDPQCQTKFNNPVTVEDGFSRKPYLDLIDDGGLPFSPRPALDGGLAPSAGPLPHAHCRLPNYRALVGQSRVKNLSGINSPGGPQGCQNDIPCP